MFYVSSRGSAASEWLAKMLSRHPQIVCFRSTRRIPPFTHGSKESPQLSAEAFIEGLLECERATYGEKVFGSLHGYHGLSAKESCERNRGIFSYIIRHPVSRIHSAFIYYLFNGYYKKYNIEMENKDIHNHVCKNLLVDDDLKEFFQLYEDETYTNRKTLNFLSRAKTLAKKSLPDYLNKSLTKLKNNILQIRKKKLPYNPLSSKTFENNKPPEEKFHAGMLFIGLTKEFLNYDSMLFKNCSINQGIKMEEMVNDRDYFKKLLRERIDPKLNFTDDYLDSVFSEKKFNIHRENPLSPEEIWQSWPEGMRKIFETYSEKYDIEQICKGFEYDLSFM